MASMGDVPDAARNKMSLCSCHKLQKNALFALKKVNIAPFTRQSLIVSLKISDTSRGPTPEVIKIREDLGSKYHISARLSNL
jgi:hypothetical protein